MKGVRRVLTWLSVAVLSVVFVYAAVMKLLDPADFANQVYAYQALPVWSVPPAAIMVPWVEMLAGIGLLIPAMRRSSALVILAMLLVFVGMAASVLYRGLDVPCGCFGYETRVVDWWLIVVDTVFAILAAFLPFHAPMRGAGAGKTDRRAASPVLATTLKSMPAD